MIDENKIKEVLEELKKARKRYGGRLYTEPVSCGVKRKVQILLHRHDP